MLNGEFGNVDRIVDNYTWQLLALPQVKNSNDVKELRNLYNTASAIAQTFKSLGISVNEYSMMLKSQILRTIAYK